MYNVSKVPELRRVWLLSGTNKHDREIYYCELSKVNKDFNLVAGRPSVILEETKQLQTSVQSTLVECHSRGKLSVVTHTGIVSTCYVV